MRPKKTNIPIIKQANEELKQATFLVLSPDEVDLHGDVYDANEVRKACHNFNTYCRKANLLHLFDTDTFSVVESYIAPVGMQMGDTVIKAGSWLAVIQASESEEGSDLWEGIKSGDFNGLSVQCTANVEDVSDNE